MTISNASRTAGPFIGNGTTKRFPFSFKVFARDDVLVARTVTATSVETILVLDSDYSVTLNNNQDSNPGGYIDMVVAPPVGTTLAATSDIDLVQSLDLTNQGGFYPRVITDALDRMVINIQQLAGKVGQGLGVGLAATTDAALAALDVARNIATSAGSSLVGFGIGVAGSISRTVQDRLTESISLKDFGAKGDGVTDDTAAILAAKAYALAHLPMVIRIPKGTYLHGDIGNWACSGLTLAGACHRSTVFKYTGAGNAFTVDAFQPGLTGNDATAPYAQSFNVRNMTFEGNANVTNILNLQGLSRCVWDRVFVRNAKSDTTGIAIHMRGVQLCNFYNIGCSTDMDKNMSSIPYEGLRMEPGSRNGVNQGNSSNNTFVNPYFEGLSIGIRLAGADQNTFISGSAESNSVYDVLVAGGSRYNSFLGMGFESPNSTANVSDAGTYSRYQNCYSNKQVYLQGRGIEISGGYFQRIEIQAIAVKCRVKDVTLKHWNGAFAGQVVGGFFDSGSQTEWKSLYDEVAAAYIYPLASRSGIAVTASPFQWTNTTGQYVEVILQTGTVTQIRILRSTDSWLNPTAIPGKHLLAPTDIIEVSYSAAPQMSYVPHNGFQG